MVDISNYIKQLSGELDDNAQASDALGRIGSKEVVTAMIKLLKHANQESRYMAARTLGLVQNNSLALSPLLEAIKAKENTLLVGDLMTALKGFDVSEHYVDIFKLYLFGSFKASLVAKELLDYKEFNITTRVVKKANKHWSHYCNNVKQDDAFQLKKIEVEEILIDLSYFLDG